MRGTPGCRPLDESACREAPHFKEQRPQQDKQESPHTETGKRKSLALLRHLVPGRYSSEPSEIIPGMTEPQRGSVWVLTQLPQLFRHAKAHSSLASFRGPSRELHNHGLGEGREESEKTDLSKGATGRDPLLQAHPRTPREAPAADMPHLGQPKHPTCLTHTVKALMRTNLAGNWRARAETELAGHREGKPEMEH